MSFWNQSPGPKWSDFLKTLSPFSSSVKPHILHHRLDQIQRPLQLAEGLSCVLLSAEHAEEMATLLKEHYQTFPKSRISLTAARIRNGFLFDGWIGCGAFSEKEGLIACCISRCLGPMRIQHYDIPESGLVDFFCVATHWRKQGLASFLLQELVFQTSKRNRLVHIFTKEGMPLSPLPPIWQSHYIVRRRGIPDVECDIQVASQEEYLLNFNSFSNRLYRSTGDSERYIFKKSSWSLVVCIADTFHRSVPEAWRIGEVCWVHPLQMEMPLDLIKEGVEAVINQCRFEVLLMDAVWPHDIGKGWKKDAMYGWYLFNCHPGTFFHLKPYLTY